MALAKLSPRELRFFHFDTIFSVFIIELKDVHNGCVAFLLSEVFLSLAQINTLSKFQGALSNISTPNSEVFQKFIRLNFG